MAGVLHALCNAHHLRELKALVEIEKAAKLAATQLRVEHWFSGVPVPIIGFVDFAFTGGIDVELKTTKARPSKPRADHVRQVALYRAARKRRGGILYVTDKRAAFYEIEDHDVGPALAVFAPSPLAFSFDLPPLATTEPPP